MPRQISEKRLAQYYKDVFATTEGQHVLADLMFRSGVLGPLQVSQNGMLADPVDPIALAILEGQRRMGLHIANTLNLKPTDFVDLSRNSLETMEGYFNAEGSTLQ